MQFNKQNLSDIRADIEAALKAVEEKHGVKFQQGNIRFTEDNFKMTMECTVDGGMSIVEQELQRAMEQFQVKEPTGTVSQLGVCRLVGYKSRNTKYPWIVEQQRTGKRFKLATRDIAMGFRNSMPDWMIR